jgi:hypothetical protein
MPSSPPKNATPPADGTRQLLQWGGSMVATGLVCAILLVTVLGGYTRLGATTNAGWFALIVALMCLPFGALLLTLGLAKWLRNHKARGSKKATQQ